MEVYINGQREKPTRKCGSHDASEPFEVNKTYCRSASQIVSYITSKPQEHGYQGGVGASRHNLLTHSSAFDCEPLPPSLSTVYTHTFKCHLTWLIQICF